jgi:hypothetical protein
MQIKQLPLSFQKDGFSFSQIKRSPYVAIYLKSKDSHSHYEVVEIQSLPPKIWPDGSISPLREAFPPPESWGSKAWTFSQNSHSNPLAAAQTKFTELSKNQGGTEGPPAPAST